MNEHEQHITPPPAGHGHAPHAAAALPFTEADWAEFRKSDKGAGGAVVVLRGAIFTMGLLLSSVIASLVLSWGGSRRGNPPQSSLPWPWPPWSSPPGCS